MTKSRLTLMDNRDYKILGVYGSQSDERKKPYVGLFSPDHASDDTVYGDSLEEILKGLYKHGYDLQKTGVKPIDRTKEEISKGVNIKELIEKIKRQLSPE